MHFVSCISGCNFNISSCDLNAHLDHVDTKCEISGTNTKNNEIRYVRVYNHKALVQNLLAFAKGVFAKCILRGHNNFNLVAALVLGRLLLCALRNCEKIIH